MFMPYLKDINELDGKFVYATRTVLFLRDDGTLKPVAIELSLPHPDGWTYGAESQVHTPSSCGVEGSIWQLAKAYVSVNDTGHHQFISHWYVMNCNYRIVVFIPSIALDFELDIYVRLINLPEN